MNKNLLKLGIFAALGLISVLVSIIALGNWGFVSGYDVYAVFGNSAGLIPKARVRIAGVDIGSLKKITLKDKKAQLELLIDKNVVLYKNASAKIVSMGIIGNKYIEIDPGDSSYSKIEDGDFIAGSEAASLEDILENFAKSSQSKEHGDIFENLAATVDNLKKFTQNMAANNDEINNIFDNFEVFSANLAAISKQLEVIIAKIEMGSGTVSTLINDEQTGQNIKTAVADAKETLEGLKSLVTGSGKLVFEWDYLGRYNLDDRVFRNDIGIKISPNDGKFYYVGVSNLGDAQYAAEDEAKQMNRLEALMGFRLKKFEIYGGIIRGQGGVGLGFSLFEPIYAPRKRVQVHVNIYDMGRKPENKPSAVPRLDAILKVGITDWLYTGVAVEDAIHKTGITPYIKLEIKDDDISRLFGVMGLAASTSK